MIPKAGNPFIVKSEEKNKQSHKPIDIRQFESKLYARKNDEAKSELCGGDNKPLHV